MMASRQVRRVPVVDPEGRLVGIIAQADIATRLQLDQKTGDLVEAISEPGSRPPMIGRASDCRPGVVGYSRSHMAFELPANHRATGLVDVLDRVLDKGLVVAGDIKVSLAEVELLTIRIRLLICSLDKAQEIGLDWWRYDRDLSPGRAPRAARRA